MYNSIRLIFFFNQAPIIISWERHLSVTLNGLDGGFQNFHGKLKFFAPFFPLFSHLKEFYNVKAKWVDSKNLDCSFVKFSNKLFKFALRSLWISLMYMVKLWKSFILSFSYNYLHSNVEYLSNIWHTKWTVQKFCFKFSFISLFVSI